jgi:hypothetical protein
MERGRQRRSAKIGEGDREREGWRGRDREVERLKERKRDIERERERGRKR